MNIRQKIHNSIFKKYTDWLCSEFGAFTFLLANIPIIIFTIILRINELTGVNITENSYNFLYVGILFNIIHIISWCISFKKEYKENITISVIFSPVILVTFTQTIICLFELLISIE